MSCLRNFGVLYVSSKSFIVFSFPSVPMIQLETILCAALEFNVTCQLLVLHSLGICEGVKAFPVFLKVLSFDLSCKDHTYATATVWAHLIEKHLILSMCVCLMWEKALAELCKTVMNQLLLIHKSDKFIWFNLIWYRTYWEKEKVQQEDLHTWEVPSYWSKLSCILKVEQGSLIDSVVSFI